MARRRIEDTKAVFDISYDIVNPSAKKTILFLHGWGSNKEIMKQAFGDTLGDFKHIYIDMPGFGNSPNDIFLTTKDYARITKRFLEELNTECDAVAGHSFGGKVATLLNPHCLILIASAGILVPKPLSVKVKIALFKLLKPLGLSRLRSIFVSDDAKGMNKGMYETFKYVVNEEFEENFKNVDSKTLLFWGKSDSATPLWTAEKISGMIADSKLSAYDGDHYFFLKHSREIASEIEKECNNK